MKEKLQAMLTAKESRKAEIAEIIKTSQNIEELKSLQAELTGINGEIRDLESMIASLPSDDNVRTAAVTAPVPAIVQAQAKEEKKASAPEPATPKSKERLHVYRNLGENLIDIKRAYSGYGISPKLEQLHNESRALGGNESIGGEGGFLVQNDFAGNMLDSAVEASPILSMVDSYNVSANSNQVYFNQLDESDISSTVYGGVQVYWAEEGETVAATKPKFKQVKLELKKLMGLAYATDEMLKDASFYGSVISRAFQTAIDREASQMVIDQIIANTGTAEVAKETSQTADTVNAKNLLKMRNTIISRNRANAIWLMNPDVYATLPEMYLTGTNSDKFIYMPQGGISAAQFDTLFGQRIVEAEECSAIGDKGDVIFADMREYLFIRKGGTEAAESMHVQFLTDQMAFRFIFRCNGIPKKSTLLTVKHSATQRAAYVTLAARA